MKLGHFPGAAKAALAVLLPVLPAALAPLRAEVLLKEDFESGVLDTTRWATNIHSASRGGIETRPEFVHSGAKSFRMTATANQGNSSGSNITYFFMPGKDKVYFRWYAKFAGDFKIVFLLKVHQNPA